MAGFLFRCDLLAKRYYAKNRTATIAADRKSVTIVKNYRCTWSMRNERINES